MKPALSIAVGLMDSMSKDCVKIRREAGQWPGFGPISWGHDLNWALFSHLNIKEILNLKCEVTIHSKLTATALSCDSGDILLRHAVNPSLEASMPHPAASSRNKSPHSCSYAVAVLLIKHAIIITPPSFPITCKVINNSPSTGCLFQCDWYHHHWLATRYNSCWPGLPFLQKQKGKRGPRLFHFTRSATTLSAWS